MDMNSVNPGAASQGHHVPHVHNEGEVEVKYKTEAETKEKALPFDIIKSALANLYPVETLTPVQLSEKVTRLLTDLSNENLNDEDLFILSELPPKKTDPELHENISSLVKIYKNIKEAGEILNSFDKGKAYKKLVKKLLLNGDKDQAIDVIEKILRTAKELPIGSQESQKLLTYAIEALIKAGEVDTAILIVDNITDNFTRESTKSDICEALARSGNSDQAFELAKTLTDSDIRMNSAYKIIIGILAKNAEIDEDTEIDEDSEADFENQIDFIAAFDTAIDKLNILSSNDRDWILSQLCNQAFLRLSFYNAFDTAIKLADKIGNPSTRGFKLWEIYVKLRANLYDFLAPSVYEKAREAFNEAILNIDREIEDAEKISNTDVRDNAYEVIVEVLLTKINKSNIKKANEVAEKITDAGTKIRVTARIAQILIDGQSGG